MTAVSVPRNRARLFSLHLAENAPYDMNGGGGRSTEPSFLISVPIKPGEYAMGATVPATATTSPGFSFASGAPWAMKYTASPLGSDASARRPAFLKLENTIVTTPVTATEAPDAASARVIMRNAAGPSIPGAPETVSPCAAIAPHSSATTAAMYHSLPVMLLLYHLFSFCAFESLHSTAIARPSDVRRHARTFTP